MKRIYISTNNDLHGLFNEMGFEDWYNKQKKSGLCSLIDILYYNSQKGIFDKESTDSDIILLSDSLTKFDINIDLENSYLLHHNQTIEHLDFILKEFKHTKKGRHILSETDLYYPAFKIIFDDTIPANQKAEKIIEKIFPDKEKKLNAALDFLHLCLSKIPTDEDKKMLTNEKIEIPIILQGKLLSDEYVNSLSELRDKLLEKVLNTD